MQLVGAHIHRYRGIENLLLPFGAVTVLIGRNGSGKSSILEALGYRPHEEGAEERLSDEAAEVSWYIQPSEQHRRACAVALRAAASLEPDDPAIGSSLGAFIPYLTVKRTGDDARLALDMFRWVIDQIPTKRRQAIAAARGSLGLRSPARWVTDTLDVLASASPPAFYDLPVQVAADLVTPPLVVSMVAGPDDISRVLHRHGRAILEAAFGPLADADVGSVLDSARDGRLAPAHVYGILQAVCEALQDRVGSFPVPLIARLGSIRVEVTEGPDGPIGEAEALVARAASRLPVTATDALEDLRQARLKLRRHDDTVDFHLEAWVRTIPTASADLHYSRLGTGTRRWVCGAIDEAARSLAEEYRSTQFTLDERRMAWRTHTLPAHQPTEHALRLRLIDEPVESLQPRLHRDLLTWLSDRLDTNERLVLSTHQASVLQVARSRDDLVVVGIDRPNLVSTARPLGPALMDSLRKHLTALSLSPEELLFAARGALLVEGADDRDAITAMYGELLAKRGIIVQSIGGASHRNIVQACKNSAFDLIDLPVWVMLDSQRDDLLETSVHWQDHRTPNDPCGRAARELGRPVSMLPFEPHDIGAGINMATYRKAFDDPVTLPAPARANAMLRRTTDATQLKGMLMRWLVPQATEYFEESGEPNTKRFTQAVMAPVIAHIVKRRLGETAASPWLKGTMNRLFVEVDDTWRRRHEQPAN